MDGNFSSSAPYRNSATSSRELPPADCKLGLALSFELGGLIGLFILYCFYYSEQCEDVNNSNNSAMMTSGRYPSDRQLISFTSERSAPRSFRRHRALEKLFSPSSVTR